MVVIGIGHARQAKVADLEIAGGVEKEVRWLEVPVKDVGGVDVFEATKDLVEEVADVIVAQPLRLEKPEKARERHIRLEKFLLC